MDIILIGVIVVLVLIILFLCCLKCYEYFSASNNNTTNSINTTNDNNASVSEKDSFHQKQGFSKTPDCVCVFDIDHTITCGEPKHSVDMCKRHNCRLAINTARPAKYSKDIDMGEMGFDEPYYHDSDFYYNPNSYSQSGNKVAQVKAGYLSSLQRKYSIPDKRRIILFDDNNENLKVAYEQNFSTIKASDRRCGLGQQSAVKINNILNKN